MHNVAEYVWHDIYIFEIHFL